MSTGLFVRERTCMLTTSFSGVDMLVYFSFPGIRPIYVGTATTLTYSTYREIRQVRVLGAINPKGLTRGQRTIGGTIIFTYINQHYVYDLLDQLSKNQMYSHVKKIKPDELPPFDILINFANEYGQKANMIIYGATIVDDGGTMSIDDLLTEGQVTYIARDIDHMKDLGKRKQDYQPSTAFKQKDEFVGKFYIDSKKNVYHSSEKQYREELEKLIKKYELKGLVM